MTVCEAYNTWAATYDSDRNLTRDLDQAVTRDTLGHARYGSILEFGSGTGKNTALLAQLAGQVHCVDFSHGMIGQAKAKQQGENVTFSVADLTRPWPFAPHSVDLIVCNLVLEHTSELSPVFAEARCVLAAGGRFFVCELHPFRQYQGTQARFQRGPERITIPAFVHHISDFLEAAKASAFNLLHFKEWWHEHDKGKAPRLASFMFQK